MFTEKETTAEKIIDLVRKSQTGGIAGRKETDIHNGFIQINYEEIELEQRELHDGNISMCMPTNFVLMDEELAQFK